MKRHQRGTVLLMSLVLLIVFDLMAVTAVKMGTTNLKIASNVQTDRWTEDVVAQAKDVVLNYYSKFDSVKEAYTSYYYFYNNAGGYVITPVTVGQRVCLGTSNISGNSYAAAVQFVENIYEYTVSATDSDGAVLAIVQGVSMNRPIGNC